MDSIDHADLILENENRLPILIQDTRISVSQYSDCNPCENCKARGFIYYCTLQGDCTSEIGKIKPIGNISTQNIPEQNSEHTSECLYDAVKHPHSILIDCVENIITTGNQIQWECMPELGNRDFYYQEVFKSCYLNI